MQLASIQQLSKSFGIRELFSSVQFFIEEGDKIALVAKNGTGKTTLLRIISGKESPDEGTVWIHKDYPVILLEQEPQFDSDTTVREALLTIEHPVAQIVNEYEALISQENPDEKLMNTIVEKMDQFECWSFESDFKQILGKLNLFDIQKKVSTLSGGQKKRLALAGALLKADLYQNKCILILDEPTNHLDVEMIEWLEEYLSASKLTLVMVTHDRYFLDNVTNEIIEIADKKTYQYRGDYNYYLEQKALRKEVEQSELAKDKNIYRRELEWIRKQPKARTTKSKSREDSFVDLEKKVKEQKADLSLTLEMKMTRLGGKVLEMKKVNKSFGDKIILKGFDYTFKKGEKIGIVGKNGSGKTTFLRIALQESLPDSGKINHGDTVIFGHFSQEGLAFEKDMRAIEYVKNIAEFFPLADGSKISAGQFMEKFGFLAEQQYTPLSKLSGGEKRRLHLLTVLFRNPNFLVLDEPTNDLDLETLQILEEFLQSFPGCLLIVSHDRYFMDKIVDHLFVFEGNGEIQNFPGNYTLYRIHQTEKEKEAKLQPAPTKNVEPLTIPVSQAKPIKLSYKEKLELENIEKELPLLQSEKSSLEQKLTEGFSFDEMNEFSLRIGEIIKLLDEKEMRWLELSEKS